MTAASPEPGPVLEGLDRVLVPGARVLVTGAAGFVGAHLVRELAAAGYEVAAVDLNPPPPTVLEYLRPYRQRIHFVRADLTVRRALDRHLAGAVDGIVHAAVLTSTPEFEAVHPERVVDANILGTLEVLRFAAAASIRRLIYISSSGVYGDTDPAVRVSETHPLRLASLYAMTKFASERLVTAAVTHEGISAASVRIAAPYGSMERPTHTRTVMSPVYALTHAAAARRRIRIARPSAARDWTHADDIARGVRLLLEAPDLQYPCYNLSSGTRVSLATIANTLVELAPGFAWTETADASDVDGRNVPDRGPLDVSRMGTLGFAPRHGLRDGLLETLKWIEAWERVSRT